MTPQPQTEAELEQRRRRITSGELIRSLLERGTTEHSSVTVSRNARGIYQFEVVVRTGDSGTVETIEDAERIAGEVIDRLADKYPYVAGGDGS